MRELIDVECVGGPECGQVITVYRVGTRYITDDGEVYIAEQCEYDGQWRAWHQGEVTSDVEANG